MPCCCIALHYIAWKVFSIFLLAHDTFLFVSFGSSFLSSTYITAHPLFRNSPREEKLFALGWKDNCCFYGNSETYMTLPSHSQRREAKDIMNHFRGDEGAAGQLACSNNSATLVCDELEQDSVVFREDLDRFVHLRHHESSAQLSREEDSYLPRSVPQVVLDLPTMLRTRSVTKATNADMSDEHHNHVWNSLEAKRSETLEQLVEHTTEYILPPPCSSSSQHRNNDRSRWSYGRFGLDTSNNQAERNRLVLECLPVLRRIGILERSSEFLEEQQNKMAEQLALDEEGTANASSSSSLRRSTRRVVTRAAAPKQRRQHYFDRLSVTLRRDEADLDTAAVGVLFANQWQSGLSRPKSK